MDSLIENVKAQIKAILKEDEGKERKIHHTRRKTLSEN